jgi:hypothetical protein
MNPLNRLLRPLGDAARAFFKADVCLRRDARGLQLVLEERGVGSRARETPAEQQARQEQQLLALMQRELQQVLDEQPGTRQTLRHLAHFESRFRRKGLRTLRRLPVPLLREALEQLESLVSNWSLVGLATLRSKLAVAVIEREHEDPAEADRRGPDSTLEDEMLLPDAGASGAFGAPGRDGDAAEMDPEAALAAAYAAALAAPPAAAEPVEMQGELGSRMVVRRGLAPAIQQPEPLRFRELQE